MVAGFLRFIFRKPQISPGSSVVTSRFDTTRHVRRVERVEPCCSNMADGEQAAVLACTNLVVFMLLHTQILFVPSNYIKLNKCILR